MNERIDRLEKVLRKHPENSNAWIELCRAVARDQTLPDFLDRARHVPLLLRLWPRVPEIRELSAVVLPLMGLQPTQRSGPPAGRWWQQVERLGRATDHDYDLETGMPLLARDSISGMEMIWVPPGAFRMGVRAADITDPREDFAGGELQQLEPRLTGETPPRPARVEGFWISRHLVSVACFRRFLEESGRPPPGVDWERQQRRPDRPVVGVSWGAAQAFARWSGSRLPRERQWEWAARGPEGLYFPWGQRADGIEPLHARFFSASRSGDLEAWDERLEDLGSHPLGAGPFGAEELLGTLWEWCEERFSLPDQEPGDLRVLRGGSWASKVTTLRSTVRVGVCAETCTPDVGFRVVKDLPRSPTDIPELDAPQRSSLSQSMVLAFPADPVEERPVGILEDLQGDRLPAGVLVRFGTERLQHGKGVTGVHFSGSGDHLYSSSADGTIRVWDAHTGKELGRFCELPSAVRCSALSPDGKTLVSGGEDAAVRLWKTRNLKEIVCIRGFKDPLESVVFSPDGTLVACGSVGGVVRVLRLDTGKRLLKLEVDRTAWLRMRFSADSGLLMTGGETERIRRFTIPDGQELPELTVAAGGGRRVVIRDFAVSPQGRLVVSSHRDGRGRMTAWDPAEGKLVEALSRGRDCPARLAYSATNLRFLAGSGREGVALYSQDGRTLVRSFDGPPMAASALALSSAAETLAAGFPSGALALWRTAGGEAVAAAPIHRTRFTAVAASADRHWVASASAGEGAFLWHGQTGKRISTVTVDGGASTCLAFSPDGDCLAIGQSQGHLQIYGVGDRSPLTFLHPVEDDLLALHFDGGANTLLLATSQGELLRCTWRPVKRNTRLRDPRRPCVAATLAPGCGLAALATAEGQVEVVDLKSGQLLQEVGMPGAGVRALALSRDGTSLLTGGEDMELRHWDLKRGGIRGTWSESDGALFAVALTRNGRVAACAGEGGRVVLLELETWKVLGRLRGHVGSVLHLEFSDDGAELLSAAEDRTALIWDVSMMVGSLS